MTQLILTFSSTNYAIKAEQALLSGELTVMVMPLPASIAAGCGLCLRIPSPQLPQAKQLLAANQVPIAAVYTRQMVQNTSLYTPYTHSAENG